MSGLLCFHPPSHAPTFPVPSGCPRASPRGLRPSCALAPPWNLSANGLGLTRLGHAHSGAQPWPGARPAQLCSLSPLAQLYGQARIYHGVPSSGRGGDRRQVKVSVASCCNDWRPAASETLDLPQEAVGASGGHQSVPAPPGASYLGSGASLAGDKVVALAWPSSEESLKLVRGHFCQRRLDSSEVQGY